MTKSHPWEYSKGLTTDLWESESSEESSEHDFSIRLDQRFTDRDSLALDFMHMSEHWRYYNNYLGDYAEYTSKQESSRENSFGKDPLILSLSPKYQYRERNSTLGHFNSVLNNVSITYNFKEGTSTPGWLRYVNNYYTYADYGTENPYSRFQGIEYQNGWELGQHKIIAGLEWHKSTASNVFHGYEDLSITTKSFYLQDTISLGDKWRVIPGLRYDYSKEFGKNWSPKIAANYRPDDKTKFYATWGRSYNLPLLNELYSNWPANENYNRIKDRRDSLFYLGNSRLQPEKGHSTIIGIEHDFNEKTGFGINYFQNKMDNLLDWTSDNVFSNFEYVSLRYYRAFNNKPLKSRGVELTFWQKVNDHFSYNLGYTHTHTHMEHSDGDISYYRPQPNGYHVGLNYKNRGLKINLLGTMASSINTNVTKVWPDTSIIQAYPKRRYAVLDFNLSYDMNENTTFYFKALNLTNQHYSNEQSNWLPGNGMKEVHPAKGRQFIYGVNYRF